MRYTVLMLRYKRKNFWRTAVAREAYESDVTIQQEAELTMSAVIHEVHVSGVMVEENRR